MSYNLKWTAKQVHQLRTEKINFRRVKRSIKGKNKVVYEIRGNKSGTIKRVQYKPNLIRIREIKEDLVELIKPELVFKDRQGLLNIYTVTLEKTVKKGYKFNNNYAELRLVTYKDYDSLRDLQIIQKMISILSLKDKKGFTYWEDFTSKFKLIPTVNRGKETTKNNNIETFFIYIHYAGGWYYENEFDL